MPVVGAQMKGLGGYACPKKGVTLGTESLSAESRCPQTEQTRLPAYQPCFLPHCSLMPAQTGLALGRKPPLLPISLFLTCSECMEFHRV